jgi:hypothetical protein
VTTEVRKRSIAVDRTFGIIRVGWIIAAAVAGLIALRVAYDVHTTPFRFPGWFPPLFVVVALGLVLWSAVLAAHFFRREVRPAASVGRTAELVLLSAPPLAAIATTSMHGFAPFIVVIRPEIIHWWDQIGPVLKFNMVLSVLALLGTVAAAILYRVRGGRVRWAAWMVYGLTVALMLVPNDDCGNPFNAWWIEVIGASPAMFLPVIYAVLFATSALLGVLPRANLGVLVVLGGGTLFLGFGHIFRFIW